MDLSLENKKRLRLSFLLCNLILIGVFLLYPAELNLILHLIPLLFFVAGFTDRRRQLKSQLLGFLFRIGPFLIVFSLYLHAFTDLTINRLKQELLLYNSLFLVISALSYLLGFVFHRYIKNEKLRWLWFISILTLLIAAFSGVVRNWPLQGILLSLVYFTAGLLVSDKDHKSNIRNYFILSGPFLLLFGGNILIGKLWHTAYFPFHVLIATCMGFLVKRSVSRKKPIRSGILVFAFVLFTAIGWVAAMNWTEYIFAGQSDNPVKTLYGLSFQDHDGREVSPDFRNKISVYYFWTTSCGVCYKKFPELNALYHEFKDHRNISIRAVNVLLSEKENPRQIYQNIRSRNYDFPLVFFRDGVQTLKKDLNLYGFPHALVINTRGEVIHNGRFNNDPLVFVDNIRGIIEKQVKNNP